MSGLQAPPLAALTAAPAVDLWQHARERERTQWQRAPGGGGGGAREGGRGNTLRERVRRHRHGLAAVAWLLTSVTTMCVLERRALEAAGDDPVAAADAFVQDPFAVASAASAALAALAAMFWVLRLALLGPLRIVESEAVTQRMRDAVLESCLALSMFPDNDTGSATAAPAFTADAAARVAGEPSAAAAAGTAAGTLSAASAARFLSGASFLSAFALCLFSKCFQVLREQRVDYIDTGAGALTRWKAVRLWALIALLLVLDGSLVVLSIANLLEGGARAHMLFAFEHAVLFIMGVNAAGRLLLAQTQGGGVSWHERRPVGFYLNVFTDGLVLILYCSFFFLALLSFGLPFHMVGDFWRAGARLMHRVGDLQRHRRNAHGLDGRFLDATEADLAGPGRERAGEGANAGVGGEGGAMSTTCVICHEEMHVGGGAPGAPAAEGAARGRVPKRMPACGHCFHEGCLRSWLERQSRCPICRTPVDPDEAALMHREQNVVRQTEEQIREEAARERAGSRGGSGGGSSGGAGWRAAATHSPVPPHVAAAADADTALAAASAGAGVQGRALGAYYVDLQKCTDEQLDELVVAQASVWGMLKGELDRRRAPGTGMGADGAAGGASVGAGAAGNAQGSGQPYMQLQRGSQMSPPLSPSTSPPLSPREGSTGRLPGHRRRRA